MRKKIMGRGGRVQSLVKGNIKDVKFPVNNNITLPKITGLESTAH
jgi:hypothetical protein